MENTNKLKLWSDDKTEDEIHKHVEYDSDTVIYNLLEDIQCLKEDNKKLVNDYEKCARLVFGA